MISAKKTIVILDQDDTNVFIIENLLKYVGYDGKIIRFHSSIDAIAYFQQYQADILFIDYFQTKNDQFSILEVTNPLPEKPDVVVLWDYDEAKVRKLSNSYAIRHYFRKPLLHEQAKMCMQSLVNTYL